MSKLKREPMVLAVIGTVLIRRFLVIRLSIGKLVAEAVRAKSRLDAALRGTNRTNQSGHRI
jgi:hypothetical protein